MPATEANENRYLQQKDLFWRAYKYSVYASVKTALLYGKKTNVNKHKKTNHENN